MSTRSKKSLGPEEPSNARVESGGTWTRLASPCHLDQKFVVAHSTTHGIYEVQCGTCQQKILRIEVERGR